MSKPIFKREYILYAILIVAAVPAGVWWLSREPSRSGPPITIGAPEPETPWEPSPKYDAEANADFSVETTRSDNSPLAGVDLGAEAEWPCFNGARRDNKSLETGLLESWPDGGPELAWACRGIGAGYSSVSLIDGVVFTMGNKGQSEAVIALDAGTGEKIWSTPIAAASQPSAGEGPRSTPTVFGDAVYALGARGDLVCLDVNSGELRWRRNILDEFAGAYPGWGVCESVLIDQGRLICTPGGKEATLVALQPDSGDLIWKTLLPDQDRAAYASATMTEVGGIRQYVQFTAAGTVGVRADDGEFLWRNNRASNPSANCSSPLVVDDLVFSASNYGNGGALVRLAASSKSVDAELVYHTRHMQSHHGDMAIVDGYVYGSSNPGVLVCLELASGEVQWRDRSVGKGALTYADGRIYLRGEQGPVALIEATPEGYHEAGRFEQPHRSNKSAWAHPVVAAGRLFLRDQDVLLCYDLREP